MWTNPDPTRRTPGLASRRPASDAVGGLMGGGKKPAASAKGDGQKAAEKAAKAVAKLRADFLKAAKQGDAWPCAHDAKSRLDRLREELTE